MRDRYLGDRERFAKVMAARSTSNDLIGLFDKLAESDRFAIPAKAFCFADLLTKCSLRVPGSKIDDLLVAIDGVWAGDIIRHALGAQADPLIGGFVRRTLELVKDDDVLERRLQLLHHAGLVHDATHALELCLTAGVPDEVTARLRDALTRIAARPRSPKDCPF